MCRARRLLAGKLRLRLRIEQQHLGSCAFVCALSSSSGTPSPAHSLGVSISCQISQLLDALQVPKQPFSRGDETFGSDFRQQGVGLCRRHMPAMTACLQDHGYPALTPDSDQAVAQKTCCGKTSTSR